MASVIDDGSVGAEEDSEGCAVVVDVILGDGCVAGNEECATVSIGIGVMRDVVVGEGSSPNIYGIHTNGQPQKYVGTGTVGSFITIHVPGGLDELCIKESNVYVY